MATRKRKVPKKRGAVRRRRRGALGFVEQQHNEEAQRAYEQARKDAKFALRAVSEGNCRNAFTGITLSETYHGKASAHAFSADYGSMVEPDELREVKQKFQDVCIANPGASFTNTIHGSDGRRYKVRGRR